MKKVLVTGISKGIGKAICERLTKEGYEVYGTYNSDKESAKQIQESNENVKVFQVDFSDRSQTKEFLNKIKTETFYAIVNNAGMIDFESWEEFTMDLWDKTMEVNLNAPLLICHTLRNQIENDGRIVNIASTDGLIGSISSIAYSASKAALLNLTQSLTNVFSDKNIRVNAVTPGWVGEGMDSPAIQDAKWINPLNRTAKYEEIAGVVNFLLSEDAGFINGESLVVDGGEKAISFTLKKEDEFVNNQE